MTLADAVAVILRSPADPRGKVVGAQIDGLPREALARREVHLGDLVTPVATLDRTAVTDNIEALQAWCDARGFRPAPHGKTTMAPQLWARQLEAGAWGITLATPAQLRAAVLAGVRRLQLANSLLDRQSIDWLAHVLDDDPGLDVLVWVDSVEAVDALSGSRRRPIRALLDVGRPGGRTGVRSRREAVEVVDRTRSAPGVELAGSAGYEGAIACEGTTTTDEVIDYVAGLLELHRDVVLPHVADEAFVSVAGSDRLAEVGRGLAGWVPGDGTVLIRSGVYVAHDDGMYQRLQTRAGRSAAGAPQFRAALRVVAGVIGVHDEGVALLDAGRRDVSFDQGLPTPLALWRGDTVIDRTDGTRPVTALNDQHAFVAAGTFRVAPRVGDRVVLGVSHPCTTFDRWRDIAELDGPVDPAVGVIGLVRTLF